MSADEFADVRRLIAQIESGRPHRRSRRLRAHPRGRILDMRRLARSSLATGGDAMQRRFRRPTTAPRKLVVLCDVSGSMEAYTRAMLLYLHAMMRSGRGVEVFAFGTRLDPGHQRARHSRSRGRAGRGRGARGRLGGRDPDRRLAEGLQRHLGPPRAQPRAPSC